MILICLFASTTAAVFIGCAVEFNPRQTNGKLSSLCCFEIVYLVSVQHYNKVASNSPSNYDRNHSHWHIKSNKVHAEIRSGGYWEGRQQIPGLWNGLSVSCVKPIVSVLNLVSWYFKPNHDLSLKYSVNVIMLFLCLNLVGSEYLIVAVPTEVWCMIAAHWADEEVDQGATNPHMWFCQQMLMLTDGIQSRLSLQVECLFHIETLYLITHIFWLWFTPSWCVSYCVCVFARLPDTSDWNSHLSYLSEHMCVSVSECKPACILSHFTDWQKNTQSRLKHTHTQTHTLICISQLS